MKRPLFRLIICLLAAVMTASAFDADAQRRKSSSSNNRQRSSATVKKEQTSTREAIKKTNRQLEANQKKTQRTLHDLDLINAEMTQLNGNIQSLQLRIDSINSASRRLADTVDILNARLDKMKQMYAKSIRATNNANNSHLTRLAFIFASNSFTQAYRRMRYLREYSDWQSRQSGEIKAKQAVLDRRRAELDSIKTVRTTSINSMKQSQASLDKRQQRADRLVKELKRENASLKRVLSDNEKRARALDSELERVIAQEQKKAAEEAKRKAAEEAKRKAAEEAAQRKAAAADNKKKTKADNTTATPAPAASKSDAKPAPTQSQTTPKKTQDTSSAPLSGKFADNRGRLPFPAGGNARIVRGFGKQQHPQLPKVTINNSGIDIETDRGSTARAVFEGTVSAIFQQSGFNTIVMLRHGEYITIYANLSHINVKNGDKVSQGQTIGTIAPDAADNSRTTLHFEIRHEKEKLDPTQWLRPHQ